MIVTPTGSKKRYDLLDGLRGVAAIMVMLFHYTQHNELKWFPGAWSAVDLFFMLSGFVITYSYADKIVAGMGFCNFMTVRLVRLSPLYYCGFVLGAINLLWASTSGRIVGMTIGQTLTALVLNFFWFPDFAYSDGVFPVDNPAWSLFFELFVNILFFGFLALKRQQPSTPLIILGILAFFLELYQFRHFNPGWGTASFIFGFPRVIAEFFAGMLLYRFAVGRILSGGWAIAALTAYIACIVLVSTLSEFINIFLVMPACVYCCATASTSGVMRRVSAFLGKLSYPVYVLHFPINLLLGQFAFFIALPLAIRVFTAVTITLGLSLLTIRPDIRTQKWLKRLLIHETTREQNAIDVALGAR